MRIWVDITNAPHVTFFKPFIDEWSKAGHEVIITARDYSNTLALIEQENIQASIIGKHYGKNLIFKIFGLFYRSVLLTKFVLKEKPDVAVSQSSFYSPIVAKITKTKCLYTNDNEHAKGNLIADKLATYVVYPEALKYNKKNVKRSLFYPGVKESIYLNLESLQKIIREKNFKEINQKIKVLFRPEPWSAQYHNNDIEGFEKFIKDLSSQFDVTVIPRDKEQHEFFTAIKNVTVLPKPLALGEITKSYDLFIGAGGSMSRELALIGLPTISVYRGELLKVDEKLIDEGILVHTEDLSVDKVIDLYDYLRVHKASRDAYIGHGIKARQLFSELLLSE